jgi:hypothetical protein
MFCAGTYFLSFFSLCLSLLCFLALSDGWWLFPIVERGIPDFSISLLSPALVGVGVGVGVGHLILAIGRPSLA